MNWVKLTDVPMPETLEAAGALVSPTWGNIDRVSAMYRSNDTGRVVDGEWVYGGPEYTILETCDREDSIQVVETPEEILALAAKGGSR